ncbi:hypothetical protein LMG24235_08246 [Paraburkholderia sabiae]|nr:hypothetical protein LMG24235_08246 [Paraburkholderia sabiae]
MQAEAILNDIMTRYKGSYIVAVEGNPPLNVIGSMWCQRCGPIRSAPRSCAKHLRLAAVVTRLFP